MAAILPFFQRRILGKAPHTAISPKHKFEGHEGVIRSFVFSQDNVYIVSCSRDGTMRKWNCKTGRLVGHPWKGESAVYSLALSPDGKTIACGRSDGTVERWDMNGQMMEDIWAGHSGRVRSVSWSPSGGDIASGSDDGTILIRNAENGQLKLGPIKTNQRWVYSVAYSPPGDKIASGGNNSICIWDSYTSQLLVGPIERPNSWVYSVVWSLDGSKLYSASDRFARVFDSTSGTELHRFPHEYILHSIALSPINVLACVGEDGVPQLWDTESVSHQPLDHRFHEENHNILRHVSFSPDGRYLAYGGDDNKITLWLVKDIAPQLLVPTANNHGGAKQETLLKSASPDVDATNPLAQSAVGDVTEEAHNNPYDDFFASSQSSLPLPSSSRRRIWHAFLPSPIYPPTDQSIRSHSLFSHRALSDSHLHLPANIKHTKPTPKGKYKAGNEDEECDDVHCSASITPNIAEHGSDKGRRRAEESIAHMQTSSPDDPSFPAESDSNKNLALWKSLMHDRRKGSSMAPTQDPSPQVVEVYAARGFKRYVAYKKKPKNILPTLVINAHTIAPCASGTSQAHPSPHGDTMDGGPSSQSMSVAGDAVQPCGANDTTDDWDSDSMIQGGCNVFLDKMCFPWGHYKQDG